ncbi:hypothetical protein D3C79_238700 [compost metagenome]
MTTVIHKLAPDEASRAMAHAVVGAVVAQARGNSAAAGAAGAVSGELMAQLVMSQLYPGKGVSELTEDQKQTISTLGTLAAGLAGGLAGGDTAGVVAGGQAGKNAVENNLLSTTSSTKWDELAEKVLQGDKTLQTAKEFLQLENADKRSDALVAKFNKEPGELSTAERTELVSYLKIYASDMQAQYGEAVTKALIAGMLTGQDYLKSAPQTEAQQKAQTIMNTWGYHKSNASIGDPVVLYGLGPLGNSIKAGMLGNAAIGVGANTVVQLGGNDPFNYVDAILAGVTAAVTTGKGIGASTAINMGGAALGSAVKGENPIGSVIGAGAGSWLGGKAGQATSGAIGQVVDKTTSDIGGAVVGSVISETVGGAVKEEIDKAGKK